MKIDQAPLAPIWLTHFPPPFQDKETFDKVFPQQGVMEPPFVLQRQQGKMFPKHPGEKAHPSFCRDAIGVVDFDPFQAAAGGVAFENKTASLPFPIPSNLFFGPSVIRSV